MKTISFFSYKGGAGRSTLAYNTIPILAKDHIKPTAQNPIVILDMDIDSCGMTYLLDSPKSRLNITDENCVQELLATGCDQSITPTIKEHPFLGKLCPVGHALGYPENDAILLVPAKNGKRINESAIANYDEGDNPVLKKMNMFRKCCKGMKVSAIMFDSAVGDNLTAVISNEFSNVIVCCMRPTRQFRDGTVSYLKRIDKGRISAGKEIVVVPNVIPTGEMIIDNHKYPNEAIYHIQEAFRFFQEEGRNHNYHLDMLASDCFGVPALPRFMWCEDILRNQEKLTDEEKLVLSRYAKLAQIIDDI